MAEHQAQLGDILEICLHAIETQGWTVEDCLSRYATYQHNLEPLLRTAQQFRSAQAIVPSSAFQEQAALRLRACLKQIPQTGPKPSSKQSVSSWLKPWAFSAQPRLAAGLIALIVVLGLSAVTTSTIHAADGALPGEPLYPVEQTVEQIQLSFAPPQKALGLRIDFAEERLSEAEQLRQVGDDGHMQEALDGYNQLISDATQMVDAGSGTEDQTQLDMVNTKLALHQARLQTLLSKTPPAAQAGISRAIEAAKHGQERAAQAIKDHGGGKPENTPGNVKPEKPDNGKPEGTPGNGKPEKPDNGKPEAKPEGGKPDK